MIRPLSIAFASLGLLAGAAGAQVTSTSPQQPALTSAQPVYTPEMRKLMDASQRLRDAIHAMAQKAPGPERTLAIRQANDALLQTQRAMLDLPPGMRSSGTASTAGYDRSVRDLMQASDALRDSIHAMARQQPGERRNEAIRDADRALMKAQVAMASAYDSSAFPQRTTTLGGPGANCVRLGDMLGCR